MNIQKEKGRLIMNRDLIGFKRLLGDIGEAGSTVSVLKIGGYVILVALVIALVIWLIKKFKGKSDK